MILTIASIVLFAAGVVALVFASDVQSDFGEAFAFFGGFIALGAGLIGGIVCVVAFIECRIDAVNIPLQYQQQKAYYDTLTGNKQITDKERTDAVQMFLSTNKDILVVREWRASAFIGVFFPRNVGDLELFDLKKIPYSTTKIDLGK